MRRIILALVFLLLAAAPAFAGTNGILSGGSNSGGGSGGTTTPGGSAGQVQYNNAGAFAGTNLLAIGTNSITQGATTLTGGLTADTLALGSALPVASGGTGGATAPAGLANLASYIGTSSVLNPQLPYLTYATGATTSGLQNNYGFATDPAKFPQFRKCYSNVKIGAGRCRVVIVGDSTSYGYDSSSNTADVKTYSWPSQLAKSLQATLGVPVDSDGFYGNGVASHTNYGFDPRLTATSNWSAAGSIPTLGGLLFSGTTGSLTFTPVKPVDSIRFWYPTNSGLGSAGIQIDSGAVTTVNESTTQGVGSTILTAATLGNHSGTFSTVSGTPYAIGFEAWDSKHPGISLINASVFGISTSGVINNTYGYYPLPTLTAVGADLVLIDLDLNDAGAGVALATYKANLHLIIAAARAGGSDVAFVTSNHATDSAHTDAIVTPYIQALYQQAATDSVPIIDNWSREVSGTYTNTAGWLNTADYLHMTGSGYADFAQGVTQFMFTVLGQGNGIGPGLINNSAAGDANFLNVVSAATTGAPSISAFGTDTNISLALLSKGTGGVGIGTSSPQNGSALDVNGTADFAQFVGRGATPTIAAGTAAGTSPTVSIAGNNIAGRITVTTGTATTANAVLATITWAGSPLTVAPQNCPLSFVGSNAVGQSLMISPSYPTTSGFTLNVAATAVPASTTYTFGYGPCGG